MIHVYFFLDPRFWILPWVLQALAYSFILKKMGLGRASAIIPFLAEKKFTGELFARRRTFYRPFIVSAILALAAWYLDPNVGMGRVFTLVAFVIYGIFLIRLYWRLGKAFSKGKFFRLVMLFIPIPLLLYLGFGKPEYTPLTLKPLKEHGRVVTFLRKAGFVTISTVELIVIVLLVGFLTIRDTPPEPLVNMMLNDTYDQVKDVTGTGGIITREHDLGKNADKIKDMDKSREHFFPDHSGDKSVVVMVYLVGSDLEGKTGLASANIRQMIDASKQGDALTFVIEAGGAKRWFTKGIEDASVGRYVIRSGEIRKVKDLPSDLCMSKPENLTDFINWTEEKYSADRRILVLWDHGGGVAYGYGIDDLNERISKAGDHIGMQTPEVVSAIKRTGLKFDIIGFDACLMQDIEVANALEPYADYYLASEEVEGGLGWSYNSAFGKLAQDPGMKSEDFGHEMVACYDPYNTAINDGKAETDKTLSFADLTLVAPAYDGLLDLLSKIGTAIESDPDDYADVAVAAADAYQFYEDQQIDLIGFLTALDKSDYDDSICSGTEREDLINAIRASVLYRNASTDKGVNGMAIAFPYKAIWLYGDTSKQLGKMSLGTEKKTFDKIFSIMAVQQKKEHDKKRNEEDLSFISKLKLMVEADYTKEHWYVSGFEEYDKARTFVDIPLKETEDGYQIELPEKAWKIIAECQTMAYQKETDEDGKTVMKYIGKDYLGDDDAEGHPMIAMDENWVHIEGKPVCYEADPVRETDAGIIFSGKVKARLNESEEIMLNIEWEPVKEGEIPEHGHVTGYDSESFMDIIAKTKSSKKLNAGDKVEFLFDYYDAKGDLIKTKTDGSAILVTKQENIDVMDSPLSNCDITFGGVLTDVYQRVMTTEQVEMYID